MSIFYYAIFALSSLVLQSTGRHGNGQFFMRPEYYPQNGEQSWIDPSKFVPVNRNQLLIDRFALISDEDEVMNSILTPFLIKNECHTSADNRVGICIPKATCLGTGGIVTGNCGFISTCCICNLVFLIFIL
jgi:hypothetical protein